MCVSGTGCNARTCWSAANASRAGAQQEEQREGGEAQHQGQENQRQRPWQQSLKPHPFWARKLHRREVQERLPRTSLPCRPPLFGLASYAYRKPERART